MTEYERPNTVAGLVAKHKELCDLRDRYSVEMRKLTVDIDHLDACIRLFDPAADTEAIFALLCMAPTDGFQPRLPMKGTGSVGRDPLDPALPVDP